MSFKLFCKVLVSLLTVAVFLEGSFHLFPQVLPKGYRASFPVGGMALDRPGLLRETSLRSIPLPLHNTGSQGPPPADLVTVYGVAPIEATGFDRERWPEIDLPIDEMGLPNSAIPEEADIVLVGDSFLVTAGSVTPAGLVVRLAAELEQSVYNLGVSAIGPLQEQYLLLEQGLPKKPRVVVWFFFGGNDLINVRETLRSEAAGIENWAEFYDGRLRPRLILPDLLRFYFSRGDEESTAAPLEPFLLPTTEGPPLPLWFAPPYLLGLALSRTQLEGLSAWHETAKTIREVHEAVRSQGAQLLVVYLPSKAQVYLPHVEANPQLTFEVANHGIRESILTPDTLLAVVLKNRRELEDLLSETCASLEISFQSATPALEALAQRGELGYQSTDTHWDSVGQNAFLPDLVQAVQSLPGNTAK